MQPLIKPVIAYGRIAAFFNQQTGRYNMAWYPHSTVATIVEKDGRFLMVEEVDTGRTVFNQPAGHLEEHESLFDAAVRETLEETAWHIELTALLGLYCYRAPGTGETYIRHCFVGRPIRHEAGRELDDGIIAAHWLTPEQIFSADFSPRSPAVRTVLRDYLKGIRYPLEVIYHHREETE